MTAEPASQEPTEEQKAAFVKRIAASIGRVITPEGNVIDAPPQEPPAAPPPPANMTLGETWERIEQTRTPSGQPAIRPAPAPAPAPAAIAPAPAAPPAAPTPAAAPAAAPAAPAPAAPAPAAPAPAPAPEPEDEEAKFLKDLSEDDMDEYEVVVFAERRHGVKGAQEAYKKFVSERKKFIEENSPGEEELADWVSQSLPEINPATRRKAERDLLITKATMEAERRSSAKVAEMQNRINQLKAQPVIDSHLARLQKGLDRDVFTEDTIEKARTAPEAVAQELDGPIALRAMQAAQTWLGIVNGVQEFNPQDEVHASVVGFVDAESRKLTLADRDGKKFVPVIDYHRSKDKAGIYTLNDGEIIDLMAKAASAQLRADLERSRRYEQRRTGKPSAPPSPTPSTATPSSSAPGAGNLGASQPVFGKIMAGLFEKPPTTSM